MIISQADFHALLNRLRGQTEIALDCEFHGEGRYYPQLCLVQIGFGKEYFALDPFKLDLRPLGDVLADNAVLKLFHSGGNDLPLLAEATGQSVRNVFDTQIAAGFLGHGAAPGYTVLLERLCGVTLSKRARFTDWCTRPLSEEQVNYALDDVRHLQPMSDVLRSELERLGRAQWAALETAEMVAKAFAPRDRSRLYLRLGPFKEMTPRNLAILREVATWRDARAEKLNRPIQTVAPDEALRQLAIQPPRSAIELQQLRGLQRLGDGAGSLMDAVSRGLSLPDEQCPSPIEPVARDERSELVCSVLATALRIRAIELNIAPMMIAKRDQIEALLVWHDSGRIDPPPEILRPGGWKQSAVGEMLLGVLDGRYSLEVRSETPGGVALISTPISKSTDPEF